MKKISSITFAAFLTLAICVSANAKGGTISTTKAGTISTTQAGTISTTAVGTISTTRTGTISTTVSTNNQTNSIATNASWGRYRMLDLLVSFWFLW